MREALPLLKHGHLMRLCASLIVSSLILIGCSSTPSKAPSPEEVVALTPLEQVAAALNAGEFMQAESILQQLQLNELNNTQYLQYLLFSAQLHLGLQEPDLSKLFLEDAAPLVTSAPKNLEQHYVLLKARYLEATGQYFAAAQLRDFQASLFQGEQAKENLQALWFDLMHLQDSELLSWADQHPNTQFSQWLQLAKIVRNSRITLDEQLSQIELWQKQHPRHPAAKELPGGLDQLQNIAQQRPQQVALLLPLTGPLAKTGEAVRDGFMASYYDSLNKGFKVPNVHIYNSHTLEDIAAIYTQAQFDGAQWVVGPIEKNKVQALQESSSLPIPTLALNYSDREVDIADETSAASQHNLFQFGLAAEDEAIQIANRAWADGKRHALVLIPQGSWGQRVYAAFEQRWLELGGDISEKRSYPNRQDYNPDIRALLNINDSQKRFSTVRMFFRDRVEFEPRRRQDADWIFMVALPQQARQIKPTLAFNFAADLPVYATSHIYSGEPNPTKDRDLNGIFYCDVPWLLQQSELYQQVEEALGHGQGSYARLYALGADAFRLLPQLNLLKTMPESQVFGNTGALQLDAEQRIVRRSECTVFRNGRPQRLTHNNL